MKKIFVDCRRGAEILATYEFAWQPPLDARAATALEQDELIKQAKTNLTDERRAFPPYDGIAFDVRYSQ